MENNDSNGMWDEYLELSDALSKRLESLDKHSVQQLHLIKAIQARVEALESRVSSMPTEVDWRTLKEALRKKGDLEAKIASSVDQQAASTNALRNEVQQLKKILEKLFAK